MDDVIDVAYTRKQSDDSACLTSADRRTVDEQAMITKRLRPIDLGLCEHDIVAAISQHRDDFFLGLLDIKIATSHASSSDGTTQAFSPSSAAELTNFLFSNCIGFNGFRRVRAITIGYQARQGSSDWRTRLRAEQATWDLRDLEQKAGSLVSSFLALQTDLRTVECHNSCLELTQGIDQLCVMAQDPNSEVSASLRRKGLQATAGVDVRLLIFEYMAKALSIPIDMMAKVGEEGRGLSRLARYFGKGFILLLPPGAMSQLNQWQGDRLERALTLFDDIVGDIILDFSEPLAANFYTPMVRGQSLPKTHIAEERDGVPLLAYTTLPTPEAESAIHGP